MRWQAVLAAFVLAALAACDGDKGSAVIKRPDKPDEYDAFGALLKNEKGFYDELKRLQGLYTEPPNPAYAAPGTNDARFDWGHAPRVNISIKPSALYSQAKPIDFQGSVRGILGRLEPIVEKVKGMGAFVCIDMEQFRYKEMTLELYRRLRSNFRDYP